MKHLVIYHANCTDGFGAAFAAWTKLGYKDVEYLPLDYGSVKTISDLCNAPKTPIEKDTIVYILDFSLPKDIMEWLFKNIRHTVWLDHHKTAFEMYDLSMPLFSDTLEGREVILDNDRSGAMIAWDYFHRNLEAPKLIQHIDDRDRWQFKIEGSRELHAALASYKPWSFVQWDFFTIPDQTQVLKEDGEAILRAQDQTIDGMMRSVGNCIIHVANFVNGDFDGESVYPGLAINTNCHMSEVGNRLANDSGTFGLVYYIGKDGKAKCSLRSNGDYDVSTIAKAFGGGGHKNAAGFSINFDVLRSWMQFNKE